ncbi:aminopeptidase [Pilimelia terevasa]|uniref:Aminopeptidase n=1 Tax=Pilimelia terevasa TaxID=53372 RepID=A0A8J3BRG0_9ACTN|nr:M28 family metallopeptidase [Pilimelia terevasa]GGK40015.1 aminopeptidase [Pilimelia terevasa]
MHSTKFPVAVPPRRGAVAAAAAALLATPLLAAPASAAPGDSASLRRAVTVQNIVNRLKTLDGIAKANGNTRAAGSRGYDVSVRYAELAFKQAGYQVSRQVLPFRRYTEKSPSVLRQESPEPAAAIPHHLLSYSGSGDVHAPATVPAGAPLGCAAADFSAANKGSVVVVGRGECTFAVKATHALAAGALGVVLYNNVPGEMSGTLGNGFLGDAPVAGVTQEVGARLVAAVPRGLRLHLKAETVRTDGTTTNVVAETPGGNPDNVVMVGAHLDSVEAGPGINDNGSGSATLLEVAHQMRAATPKNKVRFALWAAEEAGLVGSTHYVAQLPAAERRKIALYLNFDMIGSPNYVRFVYDGDNSAFPPGTGSAPGPKGSGAIEKMFHDYFAAQKLASAETPFSGRSDYGPFIAEGVGIPSGGLATGAEGIKTAEEAEVYGGRAGEAYDKCYHQACDGLANINRRGLKEMAGAVAHAVITYAADTSGVGRPLTAPASGTTTPSSDAGGLHDHHAAS